MIRNSRYNLFASECEKNTSPSQTVQGDSQSVYELFQRMVLGQYLPSSPVDSDYDFDSTEGPADFDSVDDSLNRIGFTPEEAFQLQEHFSEIGLREYESSKTPPEPEKPSSEPQTPTQSTEV